jgi:long-chain acyl-CoA synthetase
MEPIWLQHYPEEVKPIIEIPENLRLDEFISQAAKDHPNEYSLWFLEGYYTYKQLDELINRFATSLVKKFGVKENDVVSLCLPNSPQFLVAFYACQRIGATVTTLNVQYKPAEAIHCLKGSKSRLLVVLDAVYDGPWNQGSILKDTSIRNPDDVIVTNLVDMAHGLSPIKKALGKSLKKIPVGKAPGCTKFMEMLKTVPDVVPATYDAKSHVCVLLWTGGTTGMPKAAMLSTYNIVSNIYQAKEWLFKIKSGDGIIGILPFFHSFGQTVVMNFAMAFNGMIATWPRPPEVEDFLKELVKVSKYTHKTFIYFGAEILFKRVADLPKDVVKKFDLSGVFSLCVSAASPLHKEVQDAFEDKTGARLSEGYGLTEASPIVSADVFYGNRKSGTIGFPIPNTEWKIVDRETGEDMEGFGPEVTGEIAVAGPQVMLGYLPSSAEDAEEQTAKCLVPDADGKTWLLTGDIGYMLEDGRITLLDRKKELIKYRGHSVFPKEVENYMYENPAVLEVAVAGIPEVGSGEIVKAYVVLKPEYKGKVTEQQLIDWAKDKMAEWKAPKQISFKDELPKTMVGKVLRRVLRDEDLAKKAE